jgi:tetratricopeptide (TPR) repeat protein
MLTQAASALAAAGDTIRLGRLADSIQSLGTESVYGRDGRLHHHVRGLLYEARGQWDAAARELRQAIFSWTLGYTRTNLELGRTLLQLHRPEEAIAALRPALHGSLDANNTYVTRTELQEMLARAFDTAGQRDSARTYYKKVADAWRQADPQYKARQAFAEHRAASLAVKGR